MAEKWEEFVLRGGRKRYPKKRGSDGGLSLPVGAPLARSVAMGKPLLKQKIGALFPRFPASFVALLYENEPITKANSGQEVFPHETRL